jgi:pSer/pThr/pTyr-binding forkhead associated (FHA) protein
MCGEELQAAPGVDANPPGATVTNGAIGVGSGGDIKCPACENLNPPDNVVCEVCGTELHPAGSTPVAPADSTAATPTPHATSPDVTAATTPDAPSTVVAHDTPVSAPITPTTSAADGASTPDSADDITTDTVPPVAPDTNPATAADTAPDAASTPAAPGAPLQPGQVKLVVEQGMNVGKQFVLGDPEMLVGREDEEEGIYPDIDLADQDEGYVHRKHATLKFENDQLFVTHLGGANKTRLNNKPIPDNEPQAVKLGDKLAFGKVVTRVMPHA